MTVIRVIFGKSMCCYLQKIYTYTCVLLSRSVLFVGKMCVVGRGFALNDCHWPWVRRVWVDDLNKTLKGLWRDSCWQGG